MKLLFVLCVYCAVMAVIMMMSGCYKQPISSFDEICFKESVKLCKVTLEIGR